MSAKLDKTAAAIADQYPEWTTTPIRESEHGIATFRLDGPAAGWRFLKVSPRSERRIPLAAECARLRWAAPYLPVPEVVGCGSVGDFEWLMTVGIDAPDGTDPGLLAEPASLVRALAKGLRAFHEAPVADCPFDFRLNAALAEVRRRAQAGLIDPAADFHPEHSSLSLAEALNFLESRRPSTEDLVVCHGDYCFPNALISEGRVVAFVDLGELGVADRWWDVAVASWSTTWNVGPGFEDAFLEAYGIEPDSERISYYRLLYDLAS